MYKEKQSMNVYHVDDQAVEIKEAALDFTENLLALIDGGHIDSIIMDSKNAETKLYINLLPLFDDVAEILTSRIKLAETNDKNTVHIKADLSYISEQTQKKEKIIEYNVELRGNELGGYDIVSAAPL